MGLGGLLGGISQFISPITDWFSAREDREDAMDRNREQVELMREQMAAQKEFAKHGIRWRVEDAEAAGLHPLYAMGANISSYSPTTAVLDSTSRGPQMRAMGQGISRAVNAAVTRKERENQEILNGLTLERASLENDLLRHQISNINSNNNPPLPSNSDMPLLTGQGNAFPTAKGNAYVNEQPLQRVHSQPGRPAQDVGAIPDYAYVKTPRGYAIVPSADVKQRIEDQIVPEVMWSIRNNLMPFFKGHPPPDPKYYRPPKGYVGWMWDWKTQEYIPTKEMRFQMKRR